MVLHLMIYLAYTLESAISLVLRRLVFDTMMIGFSASGRLLEVCPKTNPKGHISFILLINEGITYLMCIKHINDKVHE